MKKTVFLFVLICLFLTVASCEKKNQTPQISSELVTNETEDLSVTEDAPIEAPKPKRRHFG